MIVFAIGLGAFPTSARLIRAECRGLRQQDFVQAARTQGYSHTRILLREILPNALAPIIVVSSIMAASAILAESGLSFLGLGDPNTLSWGSMIGNGREMLQSAWYISALPGGMILLTILSLNLMGDGLNRALNPRESA
ncbi:ABC transporter permease [Pseudomonas sp. GD03862]|uniref:ABC transporter permease n=1 Tax=unclassified Pseudomonas TaxID=196821 RepID=UPI002447007C|nr:ABC transporter permease [Pseudomonas sp. GD03862]MDH0704941.1 ABC transporter permease [Pseudomonas sp. GD03862]